MARPSYGQQVKKRARLLLEALLTFANDEIEASEKSLDALRPQIQIRWLTENRLVVRTKVRFLQALTGIFDPENPLNAEQIKEALKRFTDCIEILEDNRPTRGGSENWHFTLNLWCTRYDTQANLEKFDAEWEKKTTQKSKLKTPNTPPLPLPPSPSPLTNWREISCNFLEAQNHGRLTTNPLTSADGLRFELDEVYVPLGLVQRQGRERRRSDVEPYEGSRLYEPEDMEAVQTFATDEFLEQVLRQKQSKRIAILGEPGAGKTTLLQKIATWVLENTNDIPVWVSLADLQRLTLEEYLIEDWLKIATRKFQVPPEMKAEFCSQFNQERVWLLLDAIDEMAMESTNALTKVASFLKGWIADANIVLTCRLNVWDAGKNALEYFDTYRNLNFTYDDDDQVGKFICHWFKNRPKLGEKLRVELEQPGRMRIKDAVKNPLRLALLCRTWGLRQGAFPDTKAMLYEQFVDAIYEWKQDRFPTNYTLRKELNKALGVLAIAAIIQEKTKFRLRHRFVCEVLGEPDCGMFQLALQIGWLNQVGVSETQGERVYAFYHPTFQEYFAAQAVNDWQFFLNHDFHNPKSAVYRIFEPQWRSIIFLWLGRDNLPRQQKEEFIQALIDFPDKCGGYYQHQAYFLAAQGIAEFADCSLAEKIIQQLIKWRFGYFHPQKQKWWNYPSPIVEGARVSLLKSDRPKVISILEEFIQSTPNDFNTWNAAYSLGKSFDPGNPVAIAALEKLVQTVRHETIRWQAAYHLGKIDPGNQIAIAGLVCIIESSENQTNRRKAAYSLGKIDPGNQITISTLTEIINSSDDLSLRNIATNNLAALREVQDKKHQVPRINNQKNSIGDCSQANPITIAALKRGIELAKDESTRRQKAYKLAKIEPGNQLAFSTLLDILLTTKNENICKRTADNFKEVLVDEQLPEIISSLKKYFSDSANEKEMDKYREFYKLLWYCAENMSYLDFSRIWHN